VIGCALQRNRKSRLAEHGLGVKSTHVRRMSLFYHRPALHRAPFTTAIKNIFIFTFLLQIKKEASTTLDSPYVTLHVYLPFLLPLL
jgi:hypothetical protein